MIHLIFFFLLNTLSAQANSLQPLECMYDGNTKTYIKNNYSIGYPRQVIFQCGYNCKSHANKNIFLVGTHTIQIGNTYDEAHRTLCQGSTLKKTKWGYDLGGINKFYAHASKAPELKKWANLEGRNTFLDSEHMHQLSKTLEEVSSSYERVWSQDPSRNIIFYEAAVVLRDISKALSNQDILVLKKWMSLDLKNTPPLSSDFLVASIVQSSASWY